MIEIKWAAPNDAGSPIIAYDVQIQKSDGVTFAYDLVNCDGTDSEIVANAECFIPISVMLNPPFNYVWGQSIFARVSASNKYGSSQVSELGNGAKLMTLPDAPINF
jgi:hypothetical protein